MEYNSFEDIKATDFATNIINEAKYSIIDFDDNKPESNKFMLEDKERYKIIFADILEKLKDADPSNIAIVGSDKGIMFFLEKEKGERIVRLLTEAVEERLKLL